MATSNNSNSDNALVMLRTTFYVELLADEEEHRTKFEEFLVEFNND